MRFGAAAERAAADRRRDILAGLGQGSLIAALALTVFFTFFHGAKRKQVAATRPLAGAAAPAAAAPQPVLLGAADRRLDLGRVRAPQDVTRVAAWAVREADNGDSPFAIVDKRRAQVYVFAPEGRLLGTSPVLLGYAAGDYSAAGIGDKSLEEIKPHERTTPAGRFVSTPGKNASGREVVWVDYDAAVSMHRVINTNPKERRLERLASPSPAARRISWGCINVPVAFFDNILWPNLGKGEAVVYVLPETRPLTTFFPAASSEPAAVVAQAGSRRGNTAKP